MTKISAVAVDATPASTDKIIGNEVAGPASKQYNIGDIRSFVKDIFVIQPRGGKFSADINTPSSNNSAASHALMCNWIPTFIPEACTLTAIEARVTTLEVGGLVRLGLYLITAIGTTPTGILVADFGTVATDTTGIKQLSVSQAVTRNLYALCAAHSNHSVHRMRKPTGIGNPIYGESATALVGTLGWNRTGTDYSGGLPATITATAAMGGNIDGTTEVLATFT